MFRVIDGCEAELLVELVRVIRDQHPAPHFPKVGVLQDGLDKPFAETVGAVFFVDEHIAEVCKNRVIADDPRNTDLLISSIDAEHKRIFKRAFGAFPWTCVRPIGLLEKIADGIKIEPRWVGADGELVALGFEDLWHGVSLS